MKRFLVPLLTVLFLVTGVTKFLGLDFYVQKFARWGFPVWWFMYAVGAAELAGGLLLFRVRTRRLGAWLLGLIVLAALATHLRFGEWGNAGFALLVLVGLAGILRGGPGGAGG